MQSICDVSSAPAEMMPYRGISGLYEKWCSGDPAYEQTRRFYIHTLSRCKGPFLELGVGTGRLARELVQRWAADVTGVDVCPEMLSICQVAYQKQKEQEIGRAHV